jgi:hypothetical protein
VEPSPLRRPPAPLASDNLEAVAVRPNHDWLNEAAGGNRLGQFVQRAFREDTSRLIRVRLDARHGDLPHVAFWRSAGDRGFALNVAEQRRQAAAEAGRAAAGDFVAHAASAVSRGSRAISSRAKAI